MNNTKGESPSEEKESLEQLQLRIVDLEDALHESKQSLDETEADLKLINDCWQEDIKQVQRLEISIKLLQEENESYLKKVFEGKELEKSENQDELWEEIWELINSETPERVFKSKFLISRRTKESN